MHPKTENRFLYLNKEITLNTLITLKNIFWPYINFSPQKSLKWLLLINIINSPHVKKIFETTLIQYTLRYSYTKNVNKTLR